MTPEAVARASWIATGVSVAAAMGLTVVASILHFAVLRLTRMRLVAVTISAVASILIFGISPLIMDAVVDRLVNPQPVDGPLYVFRVYVDPGPLQKLIPLAAIVATWLLASAVRKKLAEAGCLPLVSVRGVGRSPRAPAPRSS
jgi:hypothetical protein